jgi:hypothetical protein
MWIEVPDGVYNIKATSSKTRYGSFTATCKPGRIVNANPPWGLHELAKTTGAKVSATWKASPTKLSSLRASSLPKGSSVTVTCSGSGCFKQLSRKASSGTLDIRKALGSRASKLRSGQTLTVTVDTPRLNSRVVSWKIPKAGKPKPVQRCIPFGEYLPKKSC